MGGREEGANECLRSVSKPTRSYSEPQPLRHKSESPLTVRTLDHRMVAARVPLPSVPKGKTKRGRRHAVLDGDA